MAERKNDLVMQLLNQQLMTVREAIKSLDTRTAALAEASSEQLGIIETLKASIENLSISAKRQQTATRKMQEDMHMLAVSLDTLATAVGGLSEIQDDHEKRISALEAKQR